MINLKDIKNIIFDLGGVLLNISPQSTIDAFLAMADSPVKLKEKYSSIKQDQIFDQLEKGKLTEIDFYNAIRKVLDNPADDSQIENAWSAMLLDFPVYRYNLVKALAKNYRLFILSNTNAIHFRHYTKIIQQSFGQDNLQDVFDKEYFSHLIGMRKPDIEIFEFVINENQLIPQETLFIDDTEANIIAARQTGLKTFHHNNGKDIIDIFPVV